jgi:cytochrome c oxidase assembly protein subunit 15/protoheme IX farnesyltransferase
VSDTAQIQTSPPIFPLDSRALPRFAWGVLACQVAVIAWGAYVRATGSGAGCGRHWPLCNGVVVPRAPRVATLIELSHRLTSGAVLVLAVVLALWAFISLPRGHRAVYAAAASLGFVLAEALIGAMLVLTEHVGQDTSRMRAVIVGLHLVNTFLLLGATTLTAWWASRGAQARPGTALRARSPLVWAAIVPLVALLLVGATGAVTALGDTLFPAGSLASGLAQDLSTKAHLFVRLRVLHPLFASLTAVLTLAALGVVRSLRPVRSVRLLANAASALVFGQVMLGVFDLVTLAPVWAQLAHLVLADALWIALVLVAAAALDGDVRAPQP